MSDFANGKIAPSAEVTLRLEKASGLSMDPLLRTQAGSATAQARRCAAEIKLLRRHRPEAATAAAI